jgi:2-desacetyl-2-hydroxyethyl bacteriochlorophyllide A dehydrogenase
LPNVRVGWCKIQTLYTSISPGTERLVYLGQVPEALYGEMKCLYMGGNFPYPVKYGYSLVGRITDGPEESMGKLVHVMHPHQDHCTVNFKDTYPVPQGIPPQRASLASNLETAVNAIWDSQVHIGDSVLVVGFGIVGSLVARLLSAIPGTRVEVADTHHAKVDLARKMGFTAFDPHDVSNGFDCAFHASGTPEGLQTAIDKVGFEGKIVELSWYGTRTVPIQLGGSFHSQRKIIISSQVSHLSGHQRVRWDHRRRKHLVFSLLQNPEFDEHITHSVPFTQLPATFSTLAHTPTEGLAYLVEYV